MGVKWLMAATGLGLALLAGVGCRSEDAQPSFGGNGQGGTTQAAAPPPAPGSPDAGNRGLLLRTGAIQLGPGPGKNLWGWQGDGKGGF